MIHVVLCLINGSKQGIHTWGETEDCPRRDERYHISGGSVQEIWSQASKILLLEGSAPEKCTLNIWEPWQESRWGSNHGWEGKWDCKAQDNHCWCRTGEPGDQKKKDWRTLAEEGTDTRSLFYDIHRTVRNAVERSEYSILSALRIMGISRSRYYSQISFSPLLDWRFNPLVVRDDDEWIAIGFKHQHPVMTFREIASTLIDEDLAYHSPSTVYNILKKHELITPWKHPLWESTRPDHAKTSDESGRQTLCI